MRVDAVMFDLDGTLADTLPGIEYSARAAAAAVLPDRALPPLRHVIGPPIRRVLAEALQVSDDAVLDALEAAFRRSYDEEGWRHSVAFPGAEGLLAALRRRGIRSFVVTNKPQLPSRRILRLLDLAGHLEDVVSPDSRQPRFTSKTEMLAHLLSVRDLDPARVLFVGDGCDDARAAGDCGVPFAAVPYGYGSAAAQREHPICLTVSCLADIAAWVMV